MLRKLLLLAFLSATNVAHAVIPAWVKSVAILANTTSPASGIIVPSTTGDTLLVAVNGTGTGIFGTPTNSLGSAVVVDCATSHFEYLRVLNAIASSQTFSIPYTGFSTVFVTIQEVTPAVVLDQCGSENTGSSTSIVSSSLTPSANDEYLLAYMKTASGAVTFSGWTNSFTQDRQDVSGPSLATGYLVQTSGPTSVNAGVTISPSESWLSMLAAYEIYVPVKTGFVISDGHALMSNGKSVVVN